MFLAFCFLSLRHDSNHSTSPASAGSCAFAANTAYSAFEAPIVVSRDGDGYSASLGKTLVDATPG